MPIRVTLLLALMLPSLTGCVFIRQKAETRLTVYPDSTETGGREIGIRHVGWHDQDGKTVLMGYGWHYREHETYAFILNEGLPPFQPRWIVLDDKEEDPDTLNLWLHRSLVPNDTNIQFESELLHYRADIEPAKHAMFGRKVITLNNAKFTSSDSTRPIWITGQIKAKRSNKDTLDHWQKLRINHIESRQHDQ